MTGFRLLFGSLYKLLHFGNHNLGQLRYTSSPMRSFDHAHVERRPVLRPAARLPRRPAIALPRGRGRGSQRDAEGSGEGCCTLEDYSRLPKVGTWMKDAFCWFFFFLCFGIGGRSCSNFMAPTINGHQAGWLETSYTPSESTWPSGTYEA